MNEMHEANRKGWDAVSPGWQRGIDRRKDWRRYPEDPSLAFTPRELEHLSEMTGKKVCVLGSGDNLAVFALAGMGARVTSVDISQTQLDIAKQRSKELSLSIDFVRSDVIDLGEIPGESFDFVYTGGHVAVWVSDIALYYNEASRIIKPDGLFIVHEYHPFRRLWAEDPNGLRLEVGYFDQGPHKYDRSEEAPEKGPLPSFEFHWTVSDLVTALLGARLSLVEMTEEGDQPQGWESAPMTGLPANLLLVGRKR
jgi:SAM-dependent methyltransferase